MHSPAPQAEAPRPFRASMATPPHGDSGAQQAHSLGPDTIQSRLQQRHKDNSQILQQRNRTSVRRFEGQHLAAHHQEKEEAHQGSAQNRAALQPSHHLFAEQGKQQYKCQQNRAARILKAPMVLNPILLNTKERYCRL